MKQTVGFWRLNSKPYTLNPKQAHCQQQLGGNSTAAPRQIGVSYAAARLQLVFRLYSWCFQLFFRCLFSGIDGASATVLTQKCI